LIKGINLGSGLGWSSDGWVGIDEINGEYLDENTVLPFSDNSVNNAFSCHFFEHINDDTAFNMFSETLRVLKPGGAFRIIVPNFKLAHKKTLNNDIKFWEDMGFTGRPEWEKNGVKKNIYNFLFHFLSNYDDGIEGQPDFYRGPPKIETHVAKEIINLSTSELCKYLYEKIPIGTNIKTQHINFWSLEKFNDYFCNFKYFKKSSHLSSKIQEIDSGKFDSWKNRENFSLYVEGVK
jgi:SAM-dependent methyltransferase